MHSLAAFVFRCYFDFVIRPPANDDLGLHPDPGGDVDLVSADGRVLVDVAERLLSVRDLHAKLAQLALVAHRRRAEAILVLMAPRLSLARVREEVDAFRAVLSPDVAPRLAVVTVDDDKADRLPDSPLTRSVAAHFATTTPSRPGPRLDRSGEALKVLVHRWLLGKGPIQMQQLQTVTGLSYPTVAAQLRVLGDAVTRGSNRSVSLRVLPVDAWTELRARRTRQAAWFADGSGRPPDLEHLVHRLRRAHPEGVALAGVLAARRRHPDIDLVGLPRLDLSVHAHSAGSDLSFLRRLDPALVRVTSAHQAVLAVHTVPREDALFEDDDGLTWADPVEALLDLQELRLDAQAEAFVKHLRAGARS